jgi:nucleoside-diphosphate-sugar epimerase
LTKDGVEVAGVVRPGADTRRLEGLTDAFSLLSVDLADTEALQLQLRRWRPDVCIHLAWYAVPGKYLTAPENIESLRVSLSLLEELSRAGCARLVAVGTCAEYDTHLGGVLSEDSPTRPDTLYAACKLSAGLIGQQRAEQLGIGFTWARIFYLYGPDENEGRMIPSLIRTVREGKEFAASAGTQVRDYLHVSDVAAALAALAVKPSTGTFNVCSGEPVTVGRLMTTLGAMLGRPELIRLGALPDRDWEPPYICGDSSRLRQATGWSPRYGLDAGLQDTLDWWSRMPASGASPQPRGLS